jgi:phosphatidate cytidylyltransferase
VGKRIFSTLILWAIVLGALYFFGPLGGVALVVLISFLTHREFDQMLRRMGQTPFDRLGLTCGLVIVLLPVLQRQAWFPFPAHIFSADIVLALATAACSLRILGEREPQNRVETLAWTLFGLVYVPWMFAFLVRIILMDTPATHSGLVLAVWLIAVAKFCDVGALLTGMACGRHKMAPFISPKKTWEGAVGGFATSALVGAGIAYFWRASLPPAFTPWVAALVALPVAGLGVVADLVESVIKRRADLKDSGRAIPGIGGMFDLSDSLILAAPVGWLAFQLLA